MSYSPEIIPIPSPIDVHVHLREPGGEDKETIASGTAAALAGGYQGIVDMPNNPGGNETWTTGHLEQKIDIARTTANTDIGFYAGVNLADPDLDEFAGMVQQAAGLKLYMDHTTGNAAKYGLETARPAIDEWIKRSREIGKTLPILLHARDSIGAETIAYIVQRGYPVHWCHLASTEEVRWATSYSMQVPELFSAGVTPHHLTMTKRNADFQQGWNGARMQPPLGREADSEALLHAYNQGYIKILETDHAPHLHDDKLKAERENPTGDTDPGCTTCYGVSGIEFVLPVMMSLVKRGLVPMERLVDSLHTQPARLLGLKRNSETLTYLQVEPYEIEKDMIVGKSSNTPYIGWEAWAKVIAVERDGRSLHSYKDVKREPITILNAGATI